jgi:hypothetical protein
MSDRAENRVDINRSTVVNTSIAVGKKARATVRVTGQGDPSQHDLAALLHALEEAVASHRDELERPAEVDAMVATVGGQLTSDEPPNRSMVQALLEGIAGAATTATAVVEAARALADFVRQMG